MKVNLSKDNSKMGKVMSVSLPPILSCGAGLPCFKGCYAAKLARLRPNVRASWENNWRMVMTDRGAYFMQIADAIEAKTPDLFRWHVAGDMPDYNYMGGMLYMAERFSDTRFLAFTKKTDLLSLFIKERRKMPTNLSVVVSMWPGFEVPKPVLRRFPTAWMNDPKNPDPRIPANAVECGGNCEKCGLCWNMKAGDVVYFKKH